MSDHTTAPRIEQIDPAAAIIGTNVRLDPRLDKEFIASVRERGVLVPIVVTQDERGGYTVRYGQRRTLAAVQTNRATIPAYVVAASDDADRIIDQLAENDHRAGVSTGERVAAVATLAGLGMTAAQIAKQTATKKTEVETALTVAASQLATKAAERWDFLTLDQAATLADFQDDTEAFKALTVAAKDGQFEHVAQRLHNDRARADRTAEAAEALAAEGTTLLDPWDPYEKHKKAERLTRLCDPADKKRTALTAETHKTCPGHAAYVQLGRAFDSGQSTIRADVTYVCIDWRKHGHVNAHSQTTSKPFRDEMTDEEREQAKADRRDVIESNRAWDDAEPVRRDWIKKFLTRRTAPKGAAVLIAQAITTGRAGTAYVDDPKAHEVARTFEIATTPEAVAKGTDGRALMLALGRVLAGYEAQTSRQSWRLVEKRNALYLRFLAENGYELSEVEKRAAGLRRTGRTT